MKQVKAFIDLCFLIIVSIPFFFIGYLLECASLGFRAGVRFFNWP